MAEKYIAKSSSWFDEGTEVILIDYLYTSPADSGEDMGVFEGLRNGKRIQEICKYSEFEVVVESSLE
jgi:hypothetical protein